LTVQQIEIPDSLNSDAQKSYLTVQIEIPDSTATHSNPI